MMKYSWLYYDESHRKRYNKKQKQGVEADFEEVQHSFMCCSTGFPSGSDTYCCFPGNVSLFPKQMLNFVLV